MIDFNKFGIKLMLFRQGINNKNINSVMVPSESNAAEQIKMWDSIPFADSQQPHRLGS